MCYRFEAVVKIIFWLNSKLPLPAVYRLGGVIGRVVYWLAPRYRKRLRDNLAEAGYADSRIVNEAAREAGRQMFEAGWIWMRPKKDLFAKVSHADFDRMQAAQIEGRPTIYLTPHLGCFEIISKGHALHAGALRRPLTVLYRVPRKNILRDVVQTGRITDHLRLAPADLHGVRMLIHAMKNNEAIGILPDQVPSHGEGVDVPFFGRPAYTMTLPARLAKQFNATLTLVYGERLPRGRGYRVHTRPLQQQMTGDATADMAMINRQLEALIRECPAQYLWGYNRYKRPATHSVHRRTQETQA